MSAPATPAPSALADAPPDRTARRRRWIVGAAVAAVVIALAAISAVARFSFLSSWPLPLGIDGYFYPIQLGSLLDTGGLYYPSSPLALYLMAPLAAATDPITGAKLGAAIGGAAIALPAFGVGARLGGRAGGLVAAALAVASYGSSYLSSEFVKNGLGLTFGLTFVWMALRALEAPRGMRPFVAAAAFVAAVLTHKMGAALALGLVAPTLIGAARTAGWGGRLTGRRLLIGAAAIVSSLVGFGIMFPERFIAGRDLALFTELFTDEPLWTAPTMSLRGGRYVLTMGHEALLAGIVGLVALAAVAWSWRAWPGPRRALAIAAAVLGVALAVPWLAVDDPDGLGFRLRLIAFVPLALSAATVAGAIGDLARPRLPERAAPIALAVVAITAVAWVAARPIDRRQGVVFPDADMAAAIGAAGAYVPEGDLIITPERLVGFMATYYTGREVHLRPEPYPAERRWRLVTQSFLLRHRGLLAAVADARREPSLTPPRGLHPNHPDGVVLIPEATWTWIVARVPAATAAQLEIWRTL